MGLKTFISYSVGDLSAVDQVQYQLEVYGIPARMGPVASVTGGAIADSSALAIQEADCVLVFATKDGERAGVLEQEVGCAARADRILVPVIERGLEIAGVSAGHHIELFLDQPDKTAKQAITFLGGLNPPYQDRQMLLGAVLLLTSLLVFSRAAATATASIRA